MHLVHQELDTAPKAGFMIDLEQSSVLEQKLNQPDSLLGH